MFFINIIPYMAYTRWPLCVGKGNPPYLCDMEDIFVIINLNETAEHSGRH